MNPTESFLEPSLTNGRLLRATVASVHEDGTVTIADESLESIRCDVLDRGGSWTAGLSKGDTVLAWYSGSGSERGVVIGPVGPHRARSPVTEAPDELVIEANKNLTLKCGEGSITIRADGKILIKGKDLVSHAQRLNRIKGGAVQIN